MTGLSFHVKRTLSMFKMVIPVTSRNAIMPGLFDLSNYFKVFNQRMHGMGRSTFVIDAVTT